MEKRMEAMLRSVSEREDNIWMSRKEGYREKRRENKKQKSIFKPGGEAKKRKRKRIRDPWQT